MSEAPLQPIEGRGTNTRNVFISQNISKKMVLESQLPHKIANLLFTITHQNTKSMILWGSRLAIDCVSDKLQGRGGLVAGVRYRGTSLIRNCPPLGPYSRTMPRAL